MIIHRYNKTTGEYLGYTKADIDPLETLKCGKDVYVIPPYFTAVEPFKPEEGHTIIFNGTEWVSIEDHRGLVVYNKKTGEPFTIADLGPIPNGYVLEKPIVLEELRREKIAVINVAADLARREEIVVRGLKSSVETYTGLMSSLNAFGEFESLVFTQDDEDILVNKELLEEVVKYFHIRSMLIYEKKKEFIKEVKTSRNKNKLAEFQPVFDVENETQELMSLNNEELNERFTK